MTSPGPHGRRKRRLRTVGYVVGVVRSFYAQPIAWAALFVSSALLSYGGGAVMFWLHAIVRREPGPAIDNVHHWLLDATLGFVALTPVLGLILPLAVWQARAADRHRPVRPSVYVLATASMFTLFTGPGPLLHNMVAGAGTPLANLATRIFGENEDAAMHALHAHPQSPVTEGLLQLGVGLPVYVACTWLSLYLVRSAIRLARRHRLDVECATELRAAARPATQPFAGR